MPCPWRVAAGDVLCVSSSRQSHCPVLGCRWMPTCWGIIALGRSEQETKARDDGSARHNAGVHGRQPSFDGVQHERVHSRSLMSGVARDRSSDALALRCAGCRR